MVIIENPKICVCGVLFWWCGDTGDLFLGQQEDFGIFHIGCLSN